jgi:hypothetical protein
MNESDIDFHDLSVLLDKVGMTGYFDRYGAIFAARDLS